MTVLEFRRKETLAVTMARVEKKLYDEWQTARVENDLSFMIERFFPAEDGVILLNDLNAISQLEQKLRISPAIIKAGGVWRVIYTDVDGRIFGANATFANENSSRLFSMILFRAMCAEQQDVKTELIDLFSHLKES